MLNATIFFTYAGMTFLLLLVSALFLVMRYKNGPLGVRSWPVRLYVFTGIAYVVLSIVIVTGVPW